MDATELLEEQHREVEDLFEKYEAANSSARKSAIFAQIGDALAAHATIEEKLFYPSVYVGDLQDMLKEAVEEHLAAKRLIADLVAMDAEDDNFDAKVKVLKEEIEHHVEEEEDELFPKVRRKFEAAALEGLGLQMKAMFDELIDQDPRNQVPDETAAAAPLS